MIIRPDFALGPELFLATPPTGVTGMAGDYVLTDTALIDSFIQIKEPQSHLEDPIIANQWLARTSKFFQPTSVTLTSSFAASRRRTIQKPETIQTSGLRLTLEVTQRLLLEMTVSMSIQSLFSAWGSIYDQAEKRQYNKHGLDFEYAVVRREDFPYLLSIGSAGLSLGDMRFVMEDFFIDLSEEERERFIEAVAVHEYGESVFNNHHQASLLEFEVVRRDGFLERYLEMLGQK